MVAVLTSTSGIPATLVDAKGDLIAATAADTVARVAVGTDGQVLTADSASTPGVKWAAAASSGAPTTATYITQTADAGLSAEQALSSLATGVLKVTTTTGVLSTATEGTDYWKPGGTDVAVADGGTGASTAAAARTNLDVPSNSEAVLKTLYDANTVLAADTNDTPAALTMGASTILARLAAGNIKAATPAELRTLLDVPTTGEAILDTLVDAKGDLIVGTADNTVARKAAGTNGYALIADSAQSDGLGWRDLGKSTRVATGRYVALGQPVSTSIVGTPIILNIPQATPFQVLAAVTFDRIGINISATGASSTVRIGIFDDVNGIPTNLIADYGTVASTATGFVEVTVSQTLLPGSYWVVVTAQGTNGCSIYMSNGGWSSYTTGAVATTYAVGSIYGPLTSGAYASTFGSVSNGAERMPHVAVRGA